MTTTTRNRQSNAAQVNGSLYQRALAFALKACPKGDDSALAQVVFVDRYIVCADGRRWHVGMLPVDCSQPSPVVATRETARALVDLLEGFRKASKGSFYVVQDGAQVVVRYHERKFTHELDLCQVGHTPDAWAPPVGAHVPEVRASTLPEVLCGHVRDVAAAWGKDKGTFVFRHDGSHRTPVAIEIHSMGDCVASAYLLPADCPAASLPPSDGLFAGVHPDQVPQGGSILQLTLDPVMHPGATPQHLTFGDLDLDVSGLGDPEALLRLGPCEHQQEQVPCLACTQVAVQARRDELAQLAAKVTQIDTAKKPGGGGKPRGGKGGGKGSGKGSGKGPRRTR